MTFDWDAGNVEHIAQHGITPEECEEAYRNGAIVIGHTTRNDERRKLCLSKTDAGRLLTFVFTERKSGIRFVTAYPMHKMQREIYRREVER